MKMSEPEDLALHPTERACLICGAKEYDWGELRARGLKPPGEHIVYRRAGETWEDGDTPTYVRRCTICGNIQIFISPM
jgi:hypothetical protein